MSLAQLKNSALAMRERAYCPYSHFQVGAALECSDGTIFTGCNVENSSYPVSLCAERVALAKAVSEGHQDFRRIVLAGSGNQFCTPCGMCRQFMAEFAPDLEVICLNNSGEAKTFHLSELLPDSFGRSTLLSD